MNHSRRRALRTIFLGTGATFVAPVLSCSRGDVQDVRRSSRSPNPVRVSSQRYAIAHRYLRDGALPSKPSVQRSTSVLVIGAGLAGITTFHLLRSHGVDVHCVEAESSVGGCAINGASPSGKAFPRGTVYFVDQTPVLTELIHSAGCTVVDCPDDAYRFGNSLVRSLWTDESIRSLTIAENDKQGMLRFRDHLLASVDEVPSYPLPRHLSRRERELDTQSAADYLHPYASSTLEAVLDAYCRSSMGAPLQDVNAYALMNFYSSELGDAFRSSRRTLVGGLGALADGLMRDAGERLVAETVAVHMERKPNGIIAVTTVNEEGVVTAWSAEHVVLATPAHVSKRLLMNVSPVASERLHTLSQAPYMTVAVELDRPVFTSGAYDTWHVPADSGYTDVITPDVVARPPSIDSAQWVCVYAPQPIQDRKLLQAEDVVAVRARDCAVEAVQREGGLAESIVSVHAWTWGHGFSVPRPGSHAALVGLQDTLPRDVHVAGTDTCGAPAMENAIASAVIAVERIIGR